MSKTITPEGQDFVNLIGEMMSGHSPSLSLDNGPSGDLTLEFEGDALRFDFTSYGRDYTRCEFSLDPEQVQRLSAWLRMVLP